MIQRGKHCIIAAMVYLDNSAATPICEAAAEAVTRGLKDLFGNPSSLHTLGARAARELEWARRTASSALHIEPHELIFTSGGTEANNMAILGAAGTHLEKKHFLTSAGEHPSVLEIFRRLAHMGAAVTLLPLTPEGQVSPSSVTGHLRDNTALISIMAVNNETGAVNDIAAVSREVHAYYAGRKPPLIHTDAVQAFTKIPLKTVSAAADLMTVSAHKLHGPKGAGALTVKKGVSLSPLFFGGGQERGLRPGTEPLPSILGFAAAVSAAPSAEAQRENFRSIYEYAVTRLQKLPFVQINSSGESTYAILNISIPGVKSETMLHFLAARDIFVSSGSACAKGKKSHVLTAMGLPDSRVDSALRISFSRENTQTDIDELIEGLTAGYASIIKKGCK